MAHVSLCSYCKQCYVLLFTDLFNTESYFHMAFFTLSYTCLLSETCIIIIIIIIIIALRKILLVYFHSNVFEVDLTFPPRVSKQYVSSIIR
jgi:hypothetical protein